MIDTASHHDVPTDPIDQAGLFEDRWREAAQQRHHAAVKASQKHPDFDGSHCVDCGIDIPAERLKNSAVRCVECQGDHELELQRLRRLGRVA